MFDYIKNWLNSYKPTDQQRVYNKLLKNGSTSVHDYPRGFALRSRISDLRNKGIPIVSVPYSENCKLVKYVLKAK